MSPSSPLPSSDGTRFDFSVSQILVALVGFYAIVTYQFVRVQSLTNRLPPTRRDAFGLDPDASTPAQYLEYLVGATLGDWGHSLWYAKPVTAALASALPWIVLLVGIAVLGALAVGAASHRLAVDALPHWAVSYSVYFAVFLVVFLALTSGSSGASGFFLAQAQQARDIPLAVGARRLVALGFVVGTLLVGVGRHRIRTSVTP